MTPMTDIQKTAVHTYKGGIHKSLSEAPDWPSLLPGLQDTLLAYVLLDLAPSTGCNSESQGAYRMIAAADELRAIALAIGATTRH
jgi:hypothetical protein